jgi:hypothetical protein
MSNVAVTIFGIEGVAVCVDDAYRDEVYVAGTLDEFGV